MSEAPRALRVVVADDEPMARATLRKLLGADPEVELVAECRDGVEALEAVRRERPDLLFLDVKMPGLDGLSVLDELGQLGEPRPAVVFTTAFGEFAVKAFEEQAVDYLLKPFDDQRFHVALERAKERVTSTSRGAPGGGSYPDRISIHREGQLELIDVDELHWVQAADQYVKLHTESGEVLMRGSMSEVERSLDPRRFARVHRSAIVALDLVVRLESGTSGNGRALLKDGSWVPVSRSRIPEVRRLLG